MNAALGKRPWNHSIHYHDVVLATVPQPCARALEAGCGTGFLTRQLAACCVQVTAVDRDAPTIAIAEAAMPPLPNIRFLTADILTAPLPGAGFDFITAVATLHHLPLEAALLRFRDLLAPGGTLAIIGLYRSQSAQDSLFAVAGRIASWTFRRTRHYTEMTAPIQPPTTILAQIRNAAELLLPGSVVKRRLLFRFSLVWRKPPLPEGRPTQAAAVNAPEWLQPPPPRFPAAESAPPPQAAPAHTTP